MITEITESNILIVEREICFLKWLIVVRKDAWNDFDFFEFIKFRFMAQDVIYPGEGSMST